MVEINTLSLLRRSSVARRMLFYVSLSGVLYGAMQFGEVIARKSLGATEFQVTLLTMVMPVASLTSIWWGQLLMGRDQRAILWVGGTIGIFAVASGVFLGTVKHLFIIYFIYFISFALLGPARNRILQQHIPGKETGGLFGLSQGLRMGLAALISAGAGWWMDRVEGGWRQLFFSVAIVGFVSIASLASIRTKRNNRIQVDCRKNWVIGPWKGVVRLLKDRPDFLRFEGAFMLYGIAFMMMLPVVPIYLVDDLALGYGSIGIAKGTVFQLVTIGSIPLFGRLFDRSTPHRMAVGAFAFGALHPLTLASAIWVDGAGRMVIVLLSFALFGIAMSGVTVLWNLASMRFAGQEEDAGLYQSVHLAAVGVRGLFAPLFGYIVMQGFGKQNALLVSSVVWILAAVAMVAARLKDQRTGQNRSLRAVG